MNIVEALAQYLIEHELVDATLGQNLFIGRRPSDPDELWNLKLNSPATGTKLVTGELQRPVTIDLYYRSRSARKVYDNLTNLDAHLNSGPVELDDFTVFEVSTSGPFTDQDVDSQDREIGLLQITLTTYKENRYVLS